MSDGETPFFERLYSFPIPSEFKQIVVLEMDIFSLIGSDGIVIKVVSF